MTSLSAALALAIIGGPFALDKLYTGQYVLFLFLNLLNATGSFAGASISMLVNLISIVSLCYAILRFRRGMHIWPYRDDIDWTPPSGGGKVMAGAVLGLLTFAVLHIIVFFVVV